MYCALRKCNEAGPEPTPKELSRGAAVPVLQEYTSRPLPVNAVYSSGRFVSAKVRLFVDYLQERLRAFPAWSLRERRGLPTRAAAPGNG
jgi:hypothetical protein